jgi:chromosome segregation ATPase
MSCDEGCWQQPELDELRAEVERLQGECENWRKLRDHEIGLHRDMRAEIERLRQERADCAAEVMRLRDSLHDEIKMLRGDRANCAAEVMRLQAEMQELRQCLALAHVEIGARGADVERRDAEIAVLQERPSSEFVELLQDQVRVLQDRGQKFEAETERLQAMFDGLQAENAKAVKVFVKVAAIAEAEIERLQAEKEQRRNRNDELLTRVGSLEAELELERHRLTTSEELRTGLIAAGAEREIALNRYRYAVVFAAAEAWDCGPDMRAVFGWARGLDGKAMTDDEVAAIGKQYLDWVDGK